MIKGQNKAACKGDCGFVKYNYFNKGLQVQITFSHQGCDRYFDQSYSERFIIRLWHIPAEGGFDAERIRPLLVSNSIMVNCRHDMYKATYHLQYDKFKGTLSLRLHKPPQLGHSLITERELNGFYLPIHTNSCYG